MKIVKATLDDFERLQELFLAFSERLAGIAPEYYTGAYQDFSLFTGIVEHKNADILIAEEDGVPVGALTLCVSERPLSPHIKPQRALRLSYFAAKNEEARRELIRAAEEEARVRGISALQILLHGSDTEARNLYTGIGFEPEITSFVKKTDEN